MQRDVGMKPIRTLQVLDEDYGSLASFTLSGIKSKSLTSQQSHLKRNTESPVLYTYIVYFHVD